MLARQPERDVLPFCANAGLATLTYMSLEHGLLTGKIGMDRVFTEKEFRSNAAWNPWFLGQNRKRVLDLLARWEPLVKQNQCSLAQLVLAWTVAQPGVTHALVGCRTEEQAHENARAGTLTLSAETLALMNADVAGVGGPAGV
jgi:aryl-alcohol dehydrogenase-like predicted oxidoreductase